MNQVLFYGGFAISILLLLVAIVMFFLFSIPRVILYFSRSGFSPLSTSQLSTRLSTRSLRTTNELDKNRSSRRLEAEDATELLFETEPLEEKSKKTFSARTTANHLANNESTELLEDYSSARRGGDRESTEILEEYAPEKKRGKRTASSKDTTDVL